MKKILFIFCVSAAILTGCNNVDSYVDNLPDANTIARLKYEWRKDYCEFYMDRKLSSLAHSIATDLIIVHQNRAIDPKYSNHFSCYDIYQQPLLKLKNKGYSIELIKHNQGGDELPENKHYYKISPAKEVGNL